MLFSLRVAALVLSSLLVAGSASAQMSAPTVTVNPMQTGTTGEAISNETSKRLDQKKTEADAKAADAVKAAAPMAPAVSPPPAMPPVK